MRAAVFIDGGYLLAQLKYNKIVPNYEKLADFLLEPIRKNIPVDLLRCYFYYCAPWMSEEPTEDEVRRMDIYKTFIKEIEALNRWEVKLGKLEKRWEGNKEYFEQKRVDVLLSCDMVRHAASRDIQHAILLAGDSDFIPAVRASKDSGVTLSLWCGSANTVHKDLAELADEVHVLNWRQFPQIGQAQNSQQPQRKRKRRTRKSAPPQQEATES